MPRMRKDESEAIIDNGLQRLELKIENTVKEKIIEFSSGFPHYIHLICEFGCKEIINNDKINFSESYLLIAIKSGIDAQSLAQ